MVDLQSLSHALQDIVTSESPDEENFTQLVERYLQSPDFSIRLLVLEILDDIITEDGSQAELDRRKEFIFKNSILTYLPLILPLHSSRPDLVSSILLTAIQVCNPREGMLALNEACQLLEEKLEKFEVSDNGLNEDDGSDMEDEEDVSERIIDQFDLLITCYSALFPRMKNMKSTPSLLPFSDAFNPLLQRIAMNISPIQAGSVLESTCHLIVKVWEWSQNSTDAGGEQKALLTQLYFMNVTLLYSNDQSSPLSRYFFSHHPQYVTPSTSGPSNSNSLSDTLVSTTSALSLDVEELIEKLSQSSFSINIYAPIACVCLLGEVLSNAGPKQNIKWPDVGCLMPSLTSAMSGRAAENVAVILNEMLKDEKSSGILNFDQASSFIELLVPLATMQPDPSLRLAYTKLIRLIIIRLSSPSEQIQLLQQILEPSNPFERFKIQALVILRELITSNVILCPELLMSLYLVPERGEIEEGTNMEWLEDEVEISLLADKITTLRLIFEIDEDNKSGIRDQAIVEKIRRSHDALQIRVRSLRKELNGAGKEEEGNQNGSAHSHLMENMRKEFEVNRLEESIMRLAQAMAI